MNQVIINAMQIIAGIPITTAYSNGVALVLLLLVRDDPDQELVSVEVSTHFPPDSYSLKVEYVEKSPDVNNCSTIVELVMSMYSKSGELQAVLQPSFNIVNHDFKPVITAALAIAEELAAFIDYLPASMQGTITVGAILLYNSAFDIEDPASWKTLFNASYAAAVQFVLFIRIGLKHSIKASDISIKRYFDV
eukprot:403370679